MKGRAVGAAGAIVALWAVEAVGAAFGGLLRLAYYPHTTRLWGDDRQTGSWGAIAPRPRSSR
ncbi:MAG: hypothetical protein ACFB9N_10945 [Geitlerinemataceae cyanobacterium]